MVIANAILILIPKKLIAAKQMDTVVGRGHPRSPNGIRSRVTGANRLDVVTRLRKIIVGGQRIAGAKHQVVGPNAIRVYMVEIIPLSHVTCPGAGNGGQNRVADK